MHFDVLGQLLKASVESGNSVSNFPKVGPPTTSEVVDFWQLSVMGLAASANPPLPPTTNLTML